jgi:hypothetical protein
MLLGSPGVLVAIVHCATPPRCGAFADERRIVAVRTSYCSVCQSSRVG